MTELVKSSTERSTDSAEYAANLLRHYSFDLGDDTIAQLLSHWQEHYPVNWIRLAAIEALYQGRYKAISVEQILALWQRRNQPLYHFNHEFERLVCDKLPQNLLLPESLPSAARLSSSAVAAATLAKLPYHSVALQLPSFKATSTLHDAEALLAIKALNGEVLMSEAGVGEHGETSVEPINAVTPAANERSLLPLYSYKLRPENQASLAIEESAAVEALEGAEEPLTLQPDAPQAMGIVPAASHPFDLEQSECEDGDQAKQDAIAPTVKESVMPLIEPDRSLSQSTKSNVVTPLTRILQQVSDQPFNAKSILPSFGLMTYALKPKLSLHLTTRYQPLWLTDVSSKHPIHQFTPEPEASDFHSKLKAVAQPLEQAPIDSTALGHDEKL